MIKVGDKIEILQSNIDLMNIGKVFYVIKLTENLFWYGKEKGKNILEQDLYIGFYKYDSFKVISSDMPNREFLAEFIKLNNIKKTRVSLYLGMAENWLTTMVNEKRETRKDISDATLQDIMRKLHIDWTSQEFINVKKTKEHTAYKTKPCNYSRVIDKERLQKAMWAGELI